MNLLFVATKAPWPPADGGRLLLAETLAALSSLGYRPTLVAPVAAEEADSVAAALSAWCRPRLVPCAAVGPISALGQAAIRGEPFSIARHARGAVRAEVERALAEERTDLIHAEQLQALAQASAGIPRGIPIVLRAQNVESDLWLATGRRQSGWRGRWLEREGRRLACFEGDALAQVAATVAISPLDAARLRTLANEAGHAAAKIHVTPAPFPVELPAGPRALRGDPAVVVLGSRGWLPNADAATWFAAEIWPAVRAALGGAVLHLFGHEGTDDPAHGIEHHPAPDDSALAFAPGSILAVPLRIASGIRMKILEAWARGVPVVATPEALAGLEVRDGRGALAAVDPRTFSRAISALHRDRALAERLIADGRRTLAERHAPIAAVRELLAVYAAVLARGIVRRSSPPTH